MFYCVLVFGWSDGRIVSCKKSLRAFGLMLASCSAILPEHKNLVIFAPHYSRKARSAKTSLELAKEGTNAN